MGHRLLTLGGGRNRCAALQFRESGRSKLQIGVNRLESGRLQPRAAQALHEAGDFAGGIRHHGSQSLA
jgi:hypothetical protein